MSVDVERLRSLAERAIERQVHPVNWSHWVRLVLMGGPARDHVEAASPAAVLALLDRLAQAEAEREGLDVERDALADDEQAAHEDYEALIASLWGLHQVDHDADGDEWCVADHVSWPCPTAALLLAAPAVEEEAMSDDVRTTPMSIGDHHHDPFDVQRHAVWLEALGHKPLPDGRCEHRWRNRTTKAVRCEFLEGFRAALSAPATTPAAEGLPTGTNAKCLCGHWRYGDAPNSGHLPGDGLCTVSLGDEWCPCQRFAARAAEPTPAAAMDYGESRETLTAAEVQQRETDDEMARFRLVETYIKSLQWSADVPETVRTIVAGNLRGFAAWLAAPAVEEEGSNER